MRQAFWLVLLVLVGCDGGRIRVTGKVVYEDGSPVESGSVIAEGTVDGKLVMVQGSINKGNVTLGGQRENDGVLPGHYKVMIVPPSLGDHELAAGMQPAIASKFTSYESSGLTLEIKHGTSAFTFTVTRPKPKGAK